MHPFLSAALGILAGLLVLALIGSAIASRNIEARKRRERREVTARLEAAVREWEQR